MFSAPNKLNKLFLNRRGTEKPALQEGQPALTATGVTQREKQKFSRQNKDFTGHFERAGPVGVIASGTNTPESCSGRLT